MGHHHFFEHKLPKGQEAPHGKARMSGEVVGGHSAGEDTADTEGGRFSDVNARMNQISIGDEDQYDFVPIDSNDQHQG